MTDEEKEFAARKEQERAAFDNALALLNDREEVKRGKKKLAEELAKHGIIPSSTENPPVISRRTVFRPKIVAVHGVPVPSVPPEQPYQDVDQPELIRGADGNWTRKEEE